MTTQPNDAAEPNADPDAQRDVDLTLTVGDVRALLARKDLEPVIATALQAAIDKQFPSDAKMIATVRGAIERKYRQTAQGAK